MNEWLVNHILSEDLSYKPYLSEHKNALVENRDVTNKNKRNLSLILAKRLNVKNLGILLSLLVFFAVVINSINLDETENIRSLNRSSDLHPPQENELDLGILVGCKGKVATIKIKNNGAIWPKLAELQLYNAGKREILIKRKMKLKSNQIVSFNIKTNKFGADLIGVWVNPTWYKRHFEYDSVVNCQ